MSNIPSMTTIRAAGKTGRAFFSVLVFAALGLSRAAADIPLLISDDHADHMEFFFRQGAGSAGMLVLDAHADTVANENRRRIIAAVMRNDFPSAGELASNHDWIHPLCPAPVDSLIWISTIHGPPRSDKLAGFLKSTGGWGFRTGAVFSSVNERAWIRPGGGGPAGPEAVKPGGALFVSIDLDFFYSENHQPEDVRPVLDAVFSWAAGRGGPQAWAICLSRPWLPDDRYAWTLLEQALGWIRARREFGRPEITLFSAGRHDTSRRARAIRARGMEVPRMNEAAAPENVRRLLAELDAAH
jgi:hypothetical protein